MNSKVAYPFTKSLRDRDKIMSEVQISKLFLALVDKQENVIISTYLDGFPKEILLHGYYFILNEQFARRIFGNFQENEKRVLIALLKIAVANISD